MRSKLVVAAMAWSVAATAASGDSVRVHRLEAEVVPGIILHTNEFLQGNNTEVRMMNRSFVAHLKYAFLPPEGSQEAIIYKGVYQGAGLSYHHFNPQLGNPVSAYLFQGGYHRHSLEKAVLQLRVELRPDLWLEVLRREGPP